jgi:hypothetical protein
MAAQVRGGKVSRMLERRIGCGLVALFATLAIAAPAAHAHQNHDHAPPAGGGAGAGGEMPPVVGGGGAVANPPANDPNAPAAGAQPAAPGAVGELPQVDVGAADPADVAVDAGIDPNAAVEDVEVGDEDLVVPIEANAAPPAAVPSPSPLTVDGGGTGGAGAAGAGAANFAGPPLAAPSGALPFTGIEESIMLVALAGMLVPIGVLLYCGARRGDLRMLQRHLAMPRFQWADPAQRPFQQPPRTDVNLQQYWPRM